MYDSDAHKPKDDMVGSGSASLVEVREKRSEVVQVGVCAKDLRCLTATTVIHLVKRLCPCV